MFGDNVLSDVDYAFSPYFLSLQSLNGIVDDYSAEPRSEGAVGVELFRPLEDSKKCTTDDVLCLGEIVGNEVCGPQCWGLVPSDQRAECGDVTPTQPFHLSFVVHASGPHSIRRLHI